jgi:hypothetical protein
LKTFLKLLIATFFVAMSSFSFAETDDSGAYLELGISSLNISYSKYSYSIGTTAVFYGGYNLNKNIAVELLGATSSSADNSTNLSFAGAFIKPKLELSESFELFARLGMNNLTYSSTFSTSSTNTYTAYGAGVTWLISGDKKQYLSLDYMNWASSNGVTLGGGGLTYGYRF